MTQTRPLSVAGLVILCLSGGALIAGSSIVVEETKTAIEQPSIGGPMGPQYQSALRAREETTRDAAMAAIDRLGGHVSLEQRSKLTRLNLEGSKVTDADLKLFRVFTDIEFLNLSRTAVTDAGLRSLRGMTKLTDLQLYETVVSDAGLAQLRRLTGLKSLMLKRTNVTDAGVAKLQRALPSCLISHSPLTPPPTAAIVHLSGRWTIEFANGVKQECEIREVGTAHVTEPLRASSGLVGVQNGKVIIAFDDERVERWTIVGKRVVVEHWAPVSPSEPKWAGYAPLRPLPTSTPVLGIAERVQ